MNTPSTSPTPTLISSSSKRHSAAGPRRLFLMDGGSISAGPSSATLPSTSPPLPSPTPLIPDARVGFRRQGASRRQSSISYLPRDGDCERFIRNAASGPTPSSLQRSNSLGLKNVPIPGVSLQGARRSSNLSPASPGDGQERSPLTLVEKHADLLQFIAQKEEKCLELRSQLEMHEAELLQLKRKWERIVSRGLSRENRAIDFHNTLPLNTPASGAVLEGIKEGVQGMSRFLASGLATPSPSPLPPHRRRQSARLSLSSTSTQSASTTNSMRLSQSSASSLGEELELPPCAEEETITLNDSDFNKEVEAATTNVVSSQLSPLSGMEVPLPICSKVYRRKSHEHSQSFTSVSPSVVSSPNEESLQSSSHIASALSSSSPLMDSETVKQSSLASKRASMRARALPPATLIPGMSSLSVAGSSVQPVSAWVGNMGKKLEELRETHSETLSKSSKRASLFLSDFTQSIASALTSPPLASSSYNPTFSATRSSEGAHTSSPSLLDDDSGAIFDGITVMTPDSKPSGGPAPLEEARPAPASSSEDQDGDEEWNW